MWYLSAPVQQDLFETANIILDIAYRLNPEELDTAHMGIQAFKEENQDRFSQFENQFMMIRKYAKKPAGLFARIASKVAAFTMLLYFNLIEHVPIEQVKSALLQLNK